MLHENHDKLHRKVLHHEKCLLTYDANHSKRMLLHPAIYQSLVLHLLNRTIDLRILAAEKLISLDRWTEHLSRLIHSNRGINLLIPSNRWRHSSQTIDKCQYFFDSLARSICIFLHSLVFDFFLRSTTKKTWYV